MPGVRHQTLSRALSGGRAASCVIRKIAQSKNARKKSSGLVLGPDFQDQDLNPSNEQRPDEITNRKIRFNNRPLPFASY